jgi:hypothetical protein
MRVLLMERNVCGDIGEVSRPVELCEFQTYLRMILRSPELHCESLPGFARSVAKTVDL